MEILKNPWKELFLEKVAASKASIKICCPYTKAPIVKEILKLKPSAVQLEVVTSFKLINYHAGASDLKALSLFLAQKAKLYNHQPVHAKVYIFDDKEAIVSSGNLTHGGLVKNYEYGILLDRPEVVKVVKSDFDRLVQHSLTGLIVDKHLEKAQEIIDQLPIKTKLNIPSDFTEDLVSVNLKTTAELLGGGQKSFIVLMQSIKTFLSCINYMLLKHLYS